MALPTLILTTDDPATAARLEAAVLDRYREPLYERVKSAGPETVEVFLNRGPNSPLWVADAPRHLALLESLVDEFGAAANWVSREKENLGLPYENFHFRVKPAAQHELFERHMKELPEFIGGFFPIIDPASGYRLVLDAVEPQAITNPYTTAWCIDASFRLVDDSGEATLDEFENYGFGRFWAPVENGRGKEQYGIPLGRPYDEVARGFRRFLMKWCGEELPASLSRCIDAKKLTIKDILEYEGE